MRLRLENIGIHFNNRWIFQGITETFQLNDKIVFIGDNGSGKSTLLKICSGFLTPEEGGIIFTESDNPIENIAEHVSLSAPYIELIEEMTLQEFLAFHFSFKKNLIQINEMISIIGLAGKENELIENFSSGMKQRVSLAQAFFADTKLLLLDEPCSNLDEKGFALYTDLLDRFTKDKIVIIASNDTKEYVGCNKQIRLSEFKN